MKRGRKPNPTARRRQTTRAGRRGDLVPPDRGTDELRRRRRHITGQDNLPADPLGALFGRELLTQVQYQAGRDVANLLEIIRPDSVQGPWLQILAGGLVGRNSQGVEISPVVERAWRLLDRLRERIGDRAATEITFAICGGDWRPGGFLFILKILNGRPWTTRDIRIYERVAATLECIATSWARDRAA